MIKRGVIFDMDGVIIDSEGVNLKYLLEFAHSKNPKVKVEELFGMIGKGTRHSWKVLEEAVHNGQSWEELLKEYRTDWDPKEKIDYRDIFRPEIRELVKGLKDKGFKLAVASSTRLALVEKVLKVNGIYEYFNQVTSGEMFKESKPDPEIYLYTAKKLGLEPCECMAMEDSTVGILAAHRAQVTVAALIDNRYGFDQSLADYQIERISDFWKVLEEAEKEPNVKP